MTTPKFAIGDAIWIATWDSSDNYVTCPDCGGTKHIRVIMHDDTEHRIACQNCGHGYNESTGRVRVYDRKPKAERHMVTGLEINGSEIKYRSQIGCSSYRIVEEELAYATEGEAYAAAVKRAAECNAEDRLKVLTKEKNTRTWAWNASYHRQCIKRAQKELEYHTAKLNVAAVKAKESV